ncbi:hypothetical protein ACQY0O_000629 [Thecaphora frezii]
MQLATSLRLVASALVAAASLTSVMASPSPPHALYVARQATGGFAAPSASGGSQMTSGTYSGAGEPLNVIISAASDPDVLTQAGFEEYVESLLFSPGDCLSISIGTPQMANLGDGNGSRNQTNIMRYNYGQGDGGTCGESLNGGNHFRYWIQNGTAANTGAIFIAASVEGPGSANHDIVANGYDLGRDWLVANATAQNGTRSPGGFEYTTTADDNTSLLAGVQASQINHGIAIDGVVKVLTVKITNKGTVGIGRTDDGSNNQPTSTPEPTSAAASLLAASSTQTLAMGAAALVLASSLVLY